MQCISMPTAWLKKKNYLPYVNQLTLIADEHIKLFPSGKYLVLQARPGNYFLVLF